MFTSIRDNIYKYFLGVFLLIMIISAPIIMVIVIGILLLSLCNLEAEERSLDRVFASPKLKYFVIASILSMISLIVSQPMEYSLEMGFPLIFITYYPLPQNSQVDAQWTDIFSRWAINPLQFCFNVGFYFILIYLFAYIYKRYISRNEA